MNNPIRMIFAGDVMLGRLVKIAMQQQGDDYPLAAISPILHRGDITIANLECAITNSEHLWMGSPKAFYFGAAPTAANALAKAGIHLVTLANNHTLDFEKQGLLDTFKYLQEQHINYVGAGIDSNEAEKPLIFTRNNMTVGIVAYCDHQADYAATAKTPGISYLDLSNEKLALGHFAKSLKKMQDEKLDWSILSLHWGPNMVKRPSKHFVNLAHRAIDMGYKMIFGHSAHIFQGIEIYHGCPIIYAAGDCIDDYYVDPNFKNDHQLLFELEIEQTKLKKILLYPIFIENSHAQPATNIQFDFIAQRVIKLCHEMGTEVQTQDHQYLFININ